MLERLIHFLNLGTDKAAHYRMIDFGGRIVGKLMDNVANGRLIERENKDARSGAIEPMNRVEILADLLAQFLQNDLLIVGIEHGAVHKITGGFGDRNERIIVVENLKHRH